MSTLSVILKDKIEESWMYPNNLTSFLNVLQKKNAFEKKIKEYNYPVAG